MHSPEQRAARGIESFIFLKQFVPRGTQNVFNYYGKTMGTRSTIQQTTGQILEKALPKPEISIAPIQTAEFRGTDAV